MTLRLAEEKDYQDVLRMARAFHEASPYNGLEFNEDQCRDFFRQYLRGDRRRLIIILAGEIPSPQAIDPSRVYGMIIGHSDSPPFSLDRVASEVAWWVDEDKRGSRGSLLLFKAYQDWALRVGSKITQMAMLDDVTNLEKFYTKQGFRPAERSYIKETY